jgi:hypothetical protein
MWKFLKMRWPNLILGYPQIYEIISSKYNIYHGKVGPFSAPGQKGMLFSFAQGTSAMSSATKCIEVTKKGKFE